jgi:hypothetical protein
LSIANLKHLIGTSVKVLVVTLDDL